MVAMMPAVQAHASTPPPTTVRHSRTLAVASLLLMLALGLAWELWLAPTGRGTLALKVLPLALPLAGLLKYRLWSYRAVTLLVWLYIAEGLVRGTTEPLPGAALAWAQVALGAALFGAALWHVRLRLGPRGAKAEGSA